MADHRRRDRAGSPPSGRDLLPEAEFGTTPDNEGHGPDAEPSGAEVADVVPSGDEPSDPEVSVAAASGPEPSDPEASVPAAAGSGEHAVTDPVAGQSVAATTSATDRLLQIYDASAIRDRAVSATTDAGTAATDAGASDQEDAAASAGSSRRDRRRGPSRRQRRRRRRRVARAARVRPQRRPRRASRRRPDSDEGDIALSAEFDDGGTQPSVEFDDDEQAPGRRGTGDALFAEDDERSTEATVESAPEGPRPAEDAETPAPTEPFPTDPVPTDPVPTDPVPTDPVPTDPVPTDPVPTDPVPTDPVPTDPVPIEPATTEPVPTGRDIGGFFASHPAPSPSIVDRLGRGGVILGVAFVLVVVAAIAVGLGWVDQARDLVATPDDEQLQDPPPGGWQPAVLLATTVSSQGSSDDLRGLAVLASDRRTGESTILLIPTATVTDVPGFGSFTLAEAWDFGGSSLVAVTVDNLLGLRIDGVLVKNQASWAAWFEPFGGASIDVPSQIVARDGPNLGTVRFDAGSEVLTPEQLAEYLVVRAEGETELQALPRAQQVIGALSRGLAETPEGLDTIVESSRTLPGTATPERIRTVLGEVAQARSADAATTITLPIVPLGTGADEVYRPDEERLDALMNDRFARSRELDVSGSRMAVQILNGNAQPGIGQDVAEALADGRYRIVLTGNADRFTYRETRILVYTDEPADLDAARDIRDRLGVGVIERSGTPQSVVDITIIVGTDFPPDG